jgi:hypothetical protein
MGALHFGPTHTLPVSSREFVELQPRLWRLSSVELIILACALVVSLCLSVFTTIEHDRPGLDQRAMLSAMLAAGGMPLIYSPQAASCTGRPIPLTTLHD